MHFMSLTQHQVGFIIMWASILVMLAAIAAVPFTKHGGDE